MKKSPANHSQRVGSRFPRFRRKKNQGGRFLSPGFSLEGLILPDGTLAPSFKLNRLLFGGRLNRAVSGLFLGMLPKKNWATKTNGNRHRH